MPEAHPFSPVINEAYFQVCLAYIATRAAALSRAVVGRELPIDTLTIFAHGLSELQVVRDLVRTYGEESEMSHGPTLYIDSDLRMSGQHVRYLGVRDCMGDDTRPQVGHAGDR